MIKFLNATRERERERERESKSLKPFAALLSTTSSPRGRRYKCGQLVAQQLLMRGQKRAFTLAEVLITLAVIGIVAALTIGVFLPKIHSTIRARQIATAEVKFTKAMEQMALNNAIGPYYETTQEFVDELQNYLKISKVCDNEHLEDCFGYEKIKLKNGEEYNVKNIKDGSMFRMPKNETSDFSGETTGIVTIDGTGMILSWNKKCPILEPKVYEWSGNTNETTNCVAGIMDINLDKSPNTQNKDIALFNALGFGDACGIEFDYDGTKYCWSTPFKPAPLTNEDCAQNKDKYGINNCVPTDDEQYSNKDYWGGAVKQCGGTANIPDGAAFADFARYLHDKDDFYFEGEKYKSITSPALNTTRLANISSELTSLLSNGEQFRIWSGVSPNDKVAWYWKYSRNDTHYNNYYRYYNAFYCYAVCVIK